MRINQYKNLDEFIFEYNDYRDPSNGKFMGIEFKYNGKYYRMCREPLNSCERMEDGTLLEYDVMQIITPSGNYLDGNMEYLLIGWYKNLNDVLENCIIDGKKFKDIIMEDYTEILGQD